MNNLLKLLKKMHVKDREMILEAMLGIEQGLLFGKKLVGRSTYRCRVGNYRIFYYKTQEGNRVFDVRRRNEKTYK